MATELAVLPQQLDDPAQLKGSHTPQPRTRAAKDSLKILDPASKKLSCLEAQRITSVLEECIRKAELSTLLPYCLHSLDRFGVVLGAELTGALQEHRRLGDNLQTLLERQEPRWEEMGALQQAIRSSLRNVLRLFQVLFWNSETWLYQLYMNIYLQKSIHDLHFSKHFQVWLVLLK